ncbi:MAG: DUF3147 family protein [Calditrichia bacterium]|nr:DUF3147 family protein [Calditrichia bacterium]
MDSLFYYRVVLSFFVAGIWIALATLLAERLGSKIGGLISNLPSNILISFVFIAVINGIPFTVDSVPGIPLGMAIDTLFLFIFIICLPYGIVISTLLSLLTWFILALILSQTDMDNLLLNIVTYLLLTVGLFLFLEKIVKISSVKKKDTRYSIWQISIRALFAGSVVASIIILAQFLPPHAVGIFSTFPAVLLTTMIILVVNQSRDFARATGKILVLSSSNIVVYGIGIYFTYPEFGIIWGTIFSFFLASLWVWLMHPLVRRLS